MFLSRTVYSNLVPGYGFTRASLSCDLFVRVITLHSGSQGKSAQDDDDEEVGDSNCNHSILKLPQSQASFFSN